MPSVPAGGQPQKFTLPSGLEEDKLELQPHCKGSCEVCRDLLSTCYIYSLNPHSPHGRRSIVIPFNRSKKRGLREVQ